MDEAKLTKAPFDISMAKKLQNGEVEGRIVTRDGRRVRIVCFDRKDLFFPIIGLIDNGGSEIYNVYPNNGRVGGISDLFMEINRDDPRAKEFLKNFFNTLPTQKKQNSENTTKNLKQRDDLATEATNDYMNNESLSGPKGSFRKGFCSGWETALRFARDLIKNSHSLPEEYSKLVDEHFDELI